jgi:hypothetical protein
MVMWADAASCAATLTETWAKKRRPFEAQGIYEGVGEVKRHR